MTEGHTGLEGQSPRDLTGSNPAGSIFLLEFFLMA